MDLISFIIGIAVGFGLKVFLDKNKLSLLPKTKNNPIKIKEVEF